MAERSPSNLSLGNRYHAGVGHLNSLHRQNNLRLRSDKDQDPSAEIREVAQFVVLQVRLYLSQRGLFHRRHLIRFAQFQIFQLKSKLIGRVNGWTAREQQINIAAVGFVFAVNRINLSGVEQRSKDGFDILFIKADSIAIRKL